MRFLCFLLLALTACGGGVSDSAAKTATDAAATVAKPAFYTAKIVAKHPHNPAFYTQGLLWHNGKLFESVGQYGTSAVMRVDLTTGVADITTPNANTDFGEGLAIVGAKFYQLTWYEGKAYTYNSNLEKTGTYNYTGQGWGLTSNNDTLYMSDGSATIQLVDPRTFKTLGAITVRDNRGEVDLINEMEWINGKIWANIYLSPIIAVIDPKTGIVNSYIDCSALITAVGNKSDIDVLNGIAYDAQTGRIFATGKYFDTLFEITF